MKTEEWRDIEGYEGLYQISSHGMVKSLSRISERGKNGCKPVGERILKTWIANGGYRRVTLSKRGVHKAVSLSRLTAIHFISNPENKPEVNHKKGLDFGDGVDNLEWVIKSENGLHSFRVLNRKPPMKGRTGKNCPNSIAINQLTTDGEFIKTWGSSMDIERELKIGNSNVIACCKGKFKTMGGYTWKYTQN